MKTKMILSLGLMMLASSSYADVTYSNMIDLRPDSNQIKLVDAHYVLLPTVTEVRPIPGCHVGEGHDSCTEIVVLKNEPVIQASISFVEGQYTGNGEGNGLSYRTLNFKLSDFPDSEVDMLRAAYPTWKHPFSTAPKRFAKDNMSLCVEKTQRTIRVLDMKKSKICPIGESGEPQRGCKEVLVYKNALTPVKAVTVSVL